QSAGQASATAGAGTNRGAPFGSYSIRKPLASKPPLAPGFTVPSSFRTFATHFAPDCGPAAAGDCGRTLLSVRAALCRPARTLKLLVLIASNAAHTSSSTAKRAC